MDEFVSPLSIDQCISRVQAAVDPPWMIFGSRMVVSWRIGRRFRIRQRIWYGNSFQTSVGVKLIQDLNGTRVECRSGMEPTTTIFMAVWFGFVGLIGMSGFLASLLDRRNSGTTAAVFAAFPIGMIAFGVVLVMFGRWLARDERDFLIRFLRGRLDARPGQTMASRLAGQG
ncbi:hypothetical protein [Phenylobacterium montanum]|uniref:Uncharacterized protein n=1 Tax=Phenylobacterium montanum TaxID=2823693 RepID=A0A975G4R8_9CAUL|nr:hypothetical protein [Caulobacter sp. S6]QUD90562.1 hypothetical protein KCG34_12175 [Caulobacter sp. S6]